MQRRYPKVKIAPVNRNAILWTVAVALLVAVAWLRKDSYAPPSAALATSAAIPIPSARLRFSSACAPAKGCANCVDCMCNEDETAVSGGGNCGPSNALTESANKYGSSNADRVERAWRVSCSSRPPMNFYALCLKR